MADPIEGYKFDHSFTGTDDGNGPVSCGKSNCGFGSYSVDTDLGVLHSPGCNECGIVVCDLTAVFDPSNINYEGPVDDNFKTAAALELVRRSNRAILEFEDPLTGILNTLRVYRNGALQEIVRLSGEAGVEYEGLVDSPKA